MNSLRYILYARKSSEAKEKQVASIEDQKAESEEYAKRNNLNIVYRIEEEKSAYRPGKRERFNQVVELIKTNKADAILVWKPDRISRNALEGGMIIQLLQDGELKEIRTPLGEIFNQETSTLVLHLMFGMASEYSKVLGQNVKRGLRHKYNRGEYPGNAIVGYRQEGDKGKKNIVPHEFEAPLIKKMFELASTGVYSYQHLSKWAFEHGLKGKRRGRRFSKAQVERIIKQPAYYGYFYRSGEMFKGNYAPLITKNLFERAQDALKDRSKPRVDTWESSSYNGLIKCPSCGCAITMSVKTKFYKGTNRTARYYYLHCTKRRGSCFQKPVTLKEFEKMIVEKVSDIVIDKKTWELGIKLLKAKHKEEVERNTEHLTRLQNDLRSCRDKLSRLIEMRADEELTKDEYLVQKQKILQEQASIEDLLRDNDDSANNWLELTEKFLDTAFYARDVMEGGTHIEKKNLIMDTGENLKLRDGKLEFSFKRPFDLLLLPEYRTSVRG